MKFYLSYFKLRFTSCLQYRKAAVAGISTQVFFGFVFLMIYIAFYESGDNTAPMKLNEVISYMWLGQAFLSLTYMYYKDSEIFNLIRTGNIAYELIRPKNLYYIWFCKVTAQRVAGCLLRFLPVLILSLLLPYPYNLTIPSVTNFILFLIILSIGTFLMSSIICLYHIIALRLLNEKGIVIFFCAIADILSGGVVPVPFLPKALYVIANIMPFRYVSDLPFRVFSGNIGTLEGVYGIGIQLIWIVMLIFIGNQLLNKILRRVVVQGG